MKTSVIALFLFFTLAAARAWPVQETAMTPCPTPKPTPAIEDWLKQLQSEDPALRLEAKNNLAALREQAAPLMLKELPAAAPALAYDLIILLEMANCREAIPVFEKLWAENNDIKVKLAAAMALCRFDRDYLTYQDYIVQQAREGEESDRLQAMQMLGYVRDARVVPVLKELFYDSSQPDKVRQAAIWDLAHTPVPESAQVLVGMVDNPEVDWFYKEIAIAATKRLAAEKGMAGVISQLLEKIQGIPAKPVPEKSPGK